MSAPLRPAALTRTSTSSAPGSGSGCSSTTISPSLTVAARIGGSSYSAPQCARTWRVGTRKAQPRQLLSPVWVTGRFLQPTPRVASVEVKVTPRSLFALPPIWREGRLGFEVAALLRNPVYRGDGVADAGGQPVLLIPGFLAGDDSLALMTRWLRRTGHHTRKAGIRSNVDCSAVAVKRLEERLEVMAESRGEKVAIVGQSRGGSFAKVLAVRRPDLVCGIVALGSPQLDPLAVHPLVRAQVYAVGVI